MESETSNLPTAINYNTRVRPSRARSPGLRRHRYYVLFYDDNVTAITM